jgi:hypothetical protein
MDLLTACADPNLFQPWFKRPETWVAWRGFIAGAFGLEMAEDEAAAFTRCTGRAGLPRHQADEVWCISGRRSGKSFVLSLIATYLATFRDWTPYLAPGERATVMVVCPDRRQARVILRYVNALLSLPLLAPLVERQRSNPEDLAFDLRGRVTIEIHTASFRSVRGYTCAAVLIDEIAFLRDENSANPDQEVLAALRPSLATVPGSMLLAASSPYARRGALFEVYRRHYAQDGAILVWSSDTLTMNPTVPQRVISEAEERDPASAESEWHGRFRSDLESYVERAAVEACIEPGVRERAPVAGVAYRCFVDPSGGRSDAMTMAIGHREGDVAVLDLVRERVPPLDPAGTAHEFAQVMRRYGVASATADRYGAEWVAQAFAGHGVSLRPAEKPKGELYRELLPALNSRRVALLDHPKLLAQLVSLERRVGRAGKDAIDHPPGPNSHDDVANSVAGVLTEAAARFEWPLVW